ncbi:MAG: DMT family transporter [Actinobacteria bacterium]|nr:DMT family transporter [Actinomycetota bacterium]
MQTRSKAVLATLVAALLFATSATSRELSGVQASSISIAAIRLSIGAIGLLIFAKMFVPNFSAISLLKNRTIWIMGLGVAGYQAFFFIGTGLTGVAIGTLSSLALAPLMAGTLSWVWQKAKPNRTWWLSTFVALIGLVVLSWSSLQEADVNLLGVLAAVVAGSAYAVYTVVGVKLSQNGESATAVLAVSFSIGAVLLISIGGSQIGDVLQGNGIWLSLWLGLVATTLAYVLFGIGISNLNAGTVATLNLAEPIAATFFGIVIIHETISTLSAIGCILIAVSLSILAIDSAKESVA